MRRFDRQLYCQMRIIKLILTLAFAWSVVGCDMTDLDLQENPNSPTPDNANVNDLYNSVQLGFTNFVEGSWGATATMSRQIAATGAYQYENQYSGVSFNGTWYNAYASLFPDIEALLVLAADRGLDIHAGSAKIMKAYVLMVLVDMFGDVPYSESLQGVDFISPMPDPGASVYQAAIGLLDEAIAQLDGTEASAPLTDNFYGGDPASWITLAKTLKLRAAVTTRLVDGSAGSIVSNIISGGDFIDSEDEDFQFEYSTNRNNPNARHPFYNNHYEAGDGVYMSNYYMWMLRGEKLDANGNPVIDPRIRFYFYRQTKNSADSEANNYSCHFSIFPDQNEKPPHYNDVDPRIPYCIASDDGYWGRDHLNNEGIPPDGPLRTVYGLYPGGGQFDDDSFDEAQQLGTTGGLGAGIQPLLLSSFVDFLRAEAALTMGTGEDAKTLLESGIRKSMEKVFGFASLVPATMSQQVTIPAGTFTVEELYVPDQDDIDGYVNYVLDEFDSSNDKLNIVMKEYYIALWGNGIEAYNMYRRTGKPNNMAPSLEPGPGEYMRSFFLPADHVNLNANVKQKESFTPVFWDDGSANLY